jgi:lysophospholipid hydrolase
MQALRSRFQPDPEPDLAHGAEGGKSEPNSGLPTRVSSRDYFNYVPPSPTVKAPSLPSMTPKSRTPAAFGQHVPLPGVSEDQTPSEAASEAGVEVDVPAQVSPPRASMFSPNTAARQSSAFVRQHSALRKQVAAGDLAMTRQRNDDENGGYYYRATAQTPGLPRMDTWLGRYPSSSHDTGHGGGEAVSPGSFTEEDAFDLKAEVVVCIAKSIGLSQQTPDGTLDPMMRGSVASASVLSSPNSPMFPPNKRGSHLGAGSDRRSPFGNVLDMMNASSSQDGVLGGMLREAVMTAKMDEDASASSFSMSVQESGIGGGDGMRSTLRDLENNLEILHYKKGSVLVKEGERAQGLYYVIDGFLDVSSFDHWSDGADGRYR